MILWSLYRSFNFHYLLERGQVEKQTSHIKNYMGSSTSSPEKIMREWFLDAARKWDSAENSKEMQKAIVSDLRRKMLTEN